MSCEESFALNHGCVCVRIWGELNPLGEDLDIACQFEDVCAIDSK